GQTDAGSGFTATGQAIGTPSYMAPEQARGEKTITTAVDIYGIGTVLYEVLTDRLPFEGENLAVILRKVMNEPPARLSAFNPKIPPDLEAIVLKCLEKDPANRYPSAEALAAELTAFARGKPVSARPPGVREWVFQITEQRPESFVGYAWEVKAWYAVLIALSQLGILAAIQLQLGILVIWAIFGITWFLGALVVQYYMGARFTRLPETEKHSMLIAVGQIVAQIVATIAYVPLSGPAVGVLDVYPALTALSGFGFFVIGTTHWGRFFYFGLGVMLLTPVLGMVPGWSPILYGTILTAIFAHWAYAVKITFAQERLAGSKRSSQGTVPHSADHSLNNGPALGVENPVARPAK
ncbi:MAG: serine/threonine-protein kinase, partial [Gemmataceae bacterium]